MHRVMIGRLVRYGISAAIIALLIMFARRIHWGEAWTAMRTASLPLLLLAIVANLSSLAFRGIRWWILLRATGSPSLSLSMRATVAGAGLNNVLVANGGDAARIVFVSRASDVPSSKVLASAALDRLFDPVGFIGLLAYGVTMLDLPPSVGWLRWPAVAAMVLVAVVLAWLTVKARTVNPGLDPERRATPREWKAKLRAWLVEFGGSMRDLASGPRILWIVLLTFLAWIGQLATFAFAAASAHVHLTLPGNLAALLAVNVFLIIRATPGNVGFFQLAYSLATHPFGVSKEAAVAVSLLIQTIQIIPVTILGILLAPEFLLKRKTPIPV